MCIRDRCCACRKGKKVVDKPLMATKWTLVELNGQQVQTDEDVYKRQILL